MRLDLKSLKKLSVETKSGAKLGAVHDLVLEIDGQLVAQYLVKPSVVSQKTYRISRDQIAQFTADKMIVDDGVVSEANAFLAQGKRVVTRNRAVAMREE